MGRQFYMASSGDPDLNMFSEADVEKEYIDGCRTKATNIHEIDSLQRWMRDAKPGDRRLIGRDEIICAE